MYVSLCTLRTLLNSACTDGCYIINQYVGQLLEESLGYGNVTPLALPEPEGKDVV
jgi:hypothetical protein